VVTLTEDLHCNSQTALRVGGDTTTINLNGFTINCTGAGYLGSCQDIAGTRGIEVVSKKGVTISGPLTADIRLKKPGLRADQRESDSQHRLQPPGVRRAAVRREQQRDFAQRHLCGGHRSIDRCRVDLDAGVVAEHGGAEHGAF
jgi:hypothetical protein